MSSLQRPSGFEGGRFGEASLPGRKPSTVPVPPGKPRQGPRGPRHDRLRGGHLKGIIARDNLREFIQGSDPKLGRWSNNKAVYTELLQVMQTCSTAKLISSLSAAQAAGANNWPEFAKANGRLRDLEDIRRTMEEASECICIEDMQRLISRALDVGIICHKTLPANNKSIQQSMDKCIEPEFQHLVLVLEKRIQKLSSLKEDLRKCCRSSDMEWISNTLKVAKELGVQWEEVSDAQVRLHVLQTSLAKMTELLGNVRSNAGSYQLKEEMHQVLTSLQHIDEDPPPPLGCVLTALRVQYNHLRLEDIAGIRDRLTREMQAAEKDADLELLRAAVAEADTQSFVTEPSPLQRLPGALEAVHWEELERGRRCLAHLVEIEAELETIVAPRVIPPSTTAIIAAIARADACGCSSWSLRSAASAQLRKVQSLEGKVLKAVQEGSEDLLREAMTDAHSAGFASWPLLHAANQLLRGSYQAGQEESAMHWQKFTSTSTAYRLLVDLAEAERFGGSATQVGNVEVAFVGIRLETADGVDCDGNEELPPLDILVDMFQKVTCESPRHARLTLVRSGLAVLEVRLQGPPERFRDLLLRLSTNQVFDFGSKVKVAQHLYSFVTRWKDQEQQQAMLTQMQRASSPGGETSVTKTSVPAISTDADDLTKEVIHRELELLREFATPASASAVCVKTTSDPGSLVEEVAAGASELLVEEVLRKQIAAGLTPVVFKRRDDSISVVSEATDVESVQLLRLIQTEFQLQQEVLCQAEHEARSEDAQCLHELLDASPKSQRQSQEAVSVKQLSQDLFSGHLSPTEVRDGIEVVDQHEDPQVTEDPLPKSLMDLAAKNAESRGYSPVDEMSCSSGPDNYTQDFVAKHVIKNAFEMLQDTEEGICKSSDISELSDIEHDLASEDAAKEVAQKLVIRSSERG